jgi:hypothetical protein
LYTFIFTCAWWLFLSWSPFFRWLSAIGSTFYQQHHVMTLPIIQWCVWSSSFSQSSVRVKLGEFHLLRCRLPIKFKIALVLINLLSTYWHMIGLLHIVYFTYQFDHITNIHIY